MLNVTGKAIIVLQAFGQYTKGQLITDPPTVSAILEGGNAKSVVLTTIHPHYLSSAPSIVEQ